MLAKHLGWLRSVALIPFIMLRVIGLRVVGCILTAWAFLMPFSTCLRHGVSCTVNCVCFPFIICKWRTADKYTLTEVYASPEVAKSVAYNISVVSVVGTACLRAAAQKLK